MTNTQRTNRLPVPVQPVARISPSRISPSCVIYYCMFIYCIVVLVNKLSLSLTTDKTVSKTKGWRRRPIRQTDRAKVKNAGTNRSTVMSSCAKKIVPLNLHVCMLFCAHFLFTVNTVHFVVIFHC